MTDKPKNRVPAEWEKHEATLLSFPATGKDWPGKFSSIKWVFIDLIKKITRYEPVIILAGSEKLKADIAEMMKKAHIDLKRTEFIILDTNRSWMRDSGPIIIKDENEIRQALRFEFRGWAKYPDYRKDRRVPRAVASYLGIGMTTVTHRGRRVVLEGGSIDTNGTGTLITTRECLLDEEIQVRNPGFTQADYEKIFRDQLGIANVIWLEKGIEGDDTHGHVDDICRFINRNTVVTVREPDKGDKNHPVLERNHGILAASCLETGEKLNVVSLPMPERIDFEDLRLPASYANFIFTNGAVLIPVFNDRNDYKALGILKELLPDRDVIGISAVDLVWGLGTLHCLSREIPA